MRKSSLDVKLSKSGLWSSEIKYRFEDKNKNTVFITLRMAFKGNIFENSAIGQLEFGANHFVAHDPFLQISRLEHSRSQGS